MKEESSSASFVRKVFSEDVSETYETINHVLTFGLDILWRKRAAKLAASAGGAKWADVCTGTGETAMYLSRLAPEGTTIHAVDASEAMMAEAKKKPEAENIQFTVSDVKDLPFENNTFDVITISFATRNINLDRETLVRTFAEFNRVLRPGGRFINLETSQPASPVIRFLFHMFIKTFVKPIGTLISGSSTGYAYLSHTIPRFYAPEELSSIIKEAGFTDVSYEKMILGIAAIHIGTK